MFFVLSGFLITALLMDRYAATGTIDIRDFWIRRFRRLVPAVVVTVIGASALAALVGGDAQVGLPRQALSAITATYNWVTIATGNAYMDQGSPLLLMNMWSLAVEQQFYLLWPIALVVMLLFCRRRFALGVAIALAATSTAWHQVLVREDLSRAYLGTDSHLWGLMLGAALALAIPGVLRRGAEVSPYARWWGIGGWVGLLAALVLMVVMPVGAMYPWGMLIVSLLTVLTIRALLPDVTAVGPGRALCGLLDAAPLRWLGERSYGIYLWHWPLWVVQFYAWPDLSPLLGAALVVLTTVLAAALSYRFIETPIRQHGFVVWMRGLMGQLQVAPPRRAIATLLVPALLLGGAGWGLATAPSRSSGQVAIEAGAAEGPAAASPRTPTAEVEQSSSLSPAPTPPEATPTEGAPSEPAPTETATDKIGGKDITVIGDSVTVAASPALRKSYPGIVIDADVSRTIEIAPDMLRRLDASGKLRPVVVLSLATNSAIQDEDVDAVLDAIGPDRELVLVTGFGPARTTWIPPSNDAIRDAATAHSQVRVADWDAAIRDHADLLAGDHVHPATTQAQELYVEAITAALR